MSTFRDVILAHALQFERPERASHDHAAGARLLVAFVVVGLILQPGLRALARSMGFAGQGATLTVIVALIIAAVLGVRWFVPVELGSVGLHRWAQWTRREKAYFMTVLPLAVVAFSLVFREHFARLAEIHGWSGLLLLPIPTGLLWGMVQELIYRGLLQTELVRRLGGVLGVLLTNLVFTFGPLHFNHLGVGSRNGPDWGMFAAIFAIGLFFGILYRRSGNLWIPAVLHGIWPANMT